MLAGVACGAEGRANGSMGLDAGDLDGSGRPWLWVTNFQNELHALYRNKMIGDRQHFLYSTRVSGIAAIGQMYVGWGTCFIDTDNRGLLDIFVSNITDEYPGQRPWAFTGGTLKRVAVDVSGEPYVDLERAAAAMIARE